MASKKKSSAGGGGSGLVGLLLRVVAELDRAGIPYMLIGGMAVIQHGEPRFTRDVALTIGVDPLAPRAAETLLGLLPEMGLRPLSADPHELIRRGAMLPCVDVQTGLTVDMALGATEFERLALARAQTVVLSGRSVRVCTPEDLIIHKIVAQRGRDLDDVRGILLRQKRLNLPEVRRWLRALEPEVDRPLLDVFERIVRDARRR